MRHLKGVSPLIAAVLLVAFTMATALVVVTWITDFTQQQTSNIGARGEQQTLCAYSTLSIDRDDISVISNITNVTVTYSTGSEILNITGFTVRDANGVTYVNTTSPNTDSVVRNLGVGSSVKLTNYLLTGQIPSGVAWKEVRVTAVCQSRYVVAGTVTGQ
ncbi:MAG: hypothetical protein HY516_00415 [Candidatus Aenigmarchaeota archaeon]|nr:hypothetical protein [Candidatus Aenigmarchaeota archaeon]